jgi:hypothetical protein
MSWSEDERAAFLAGLGDLAPGGDISAWVAWCAARLEATRQEIGRVPGDERVRAGLLRLLSALPMAPSEAARWRADARAALATWQATDHPSAWVARPPAWLGLATWEMADGEGASEDEGLGLGIRAAATAFASMPDRPAAADGEVAWAMAEVASEAGWSDRAGPLWERALVGPFSDPGYAAQVAWLVAAEVADADRGRARALLDEAAGIDEAEDATLLGVLLFAAELALRDDDRAGARARLAIAAELLEDAGDEDDAARHAALVAAAR